MGYIYQNAAALRFAGMIVTAIVIAASFASHDVSRIFTDRQFYTARNAAMMTSGIGTAQDAQIGRDYMSTSSRDRKVFGAVDATVQGLIQNLIVQPIATHNFQARNESVTKS